MSASLVLSLREGIHLAPGADGELALQTPHTLLALQHILFGVRTALEQLTPPGAREERLANGSWSPARS